MKFAEIRGKLALVLLAAICLLAVPALSRPADDNPGGFCQGPMFVLQSFSDHAKDLTSPVNE